MTPEEKMRLEKVEKFIAQLEASDRYFFTKHLHLFDGVNFQTDRRTGTKIATASDQKLGLWGTTPVIQPVAIADVAGGGADSDGTARTKINAILAALRLPGFIDT